MPAPKIVEKPKSQSGEVPFFGQSSSREFAAFNCADESALIALIIGSPAIVPVVNVVNGVPLLIDKYAYREFEGGNWDVTASYKGTANQWRVSIDTSGGTRKLLYSDTTVYAYDCQSVGAGLPGTGGIADFKQAIGVTSSGIDGVDVTDPKFNISLNVTLKMSTLSASYLLTLKALTGKVNDSPYTLTYNGQVIRFDTEELLFLGATVNQASTDDLDLNYKFSGQDSVVTADNKTIGLSRPIEKQGWQYLWVYYTEVNDTTTSRILRRPITAYVERVFKLADFTQLAL